MPSTQEVRLPQLIGDRLLEIPDYQRPYAWQKKQLEDLWEDIDLLGSTGNHYAGTLVLRDIPDGSGSPPAVRVADDGTTLRRCEVVDGQQRLTTCIVLLERIRHRLLRLAHADVANAKEMADRLRATYGMVTVDEAHIPRLRLGSDLNEYWTEHILNDSTFAAPTLLAGQRRLKEAVEFFDTKLHELAREADPEEEFRRLKELQRRVTAGLGFLVYEVGSVADVGVIFETLNERGRSLTDLEKTKNYLLYLARSIHGERGDQLAQLVNSAWATIFVNLAKESGDADGQLLRAHWLATQDPDRSAWKRIASIKARFDRSKYISGKTRIVPNALAEQDQDAAWDRLVDDVGNYVRSLRDCSYFLADMYDPLATYEAFQERGSEVRARNAALRRSGITALYRPLLFAARLRHPQDGELYADLLDVCERYSARVFVIEQRRANTGEPRLLRLAHDLYHGADSQHVLREVNATLWRYAPDARVLETLQSVSMNWYWRRGHKYVLYEYELSLRPQGEAELRALEYFTDGARKQRTTEHILPQQPDLDDTCWWDAFTSEQHAELVHSLGNLVLTYDNSSYGRKCFADKRGAPLVPATTPRRCYSQADLRQELELAQHEEWTPSEITARQLDLAQWAMKRWAVRPPTPEDYLEGDEIEDEALEGEELESANPAWRAVE